MSLLLATLLVTSIQISQQDSTQDNEQLETTPIVIMGHDPGQGDAG